MVHQELDKMYPDVMLKQLQRCLENYYKEVLKIWGASGHSDMAVYKHKFNEVLEDMGSQLEQGEPVDSDGAPAMPASGDGAGAEDTGPAASAAEAADAPPSKGRNGKKRGI